MEERFVLHEFVGQLLVESSAEVAVVRLNRNPADDDAVGEGRCRDEGEDLRVEAASYGVIFSHMGAYDCISCIAESFDATT